jgi:hypothetical protein
MSDSPDTDLDLEELELQLLPAWAKQSPDTNRFAKYEGGGDSGPRDRDRGERRARQPGRPTRGDARSGDQRRPRDAGARPPRREGQGRFDRPRREEQREPDQPLPELSLNIAPEEKGLESLARQIKLTGRAYPIFDIAHLILKKPDRYHVRFGVVKKADGQTAQPLWVCNLDDTLWLSDQDATGHVLRKHFDTFYKAERTPTDPPKGTYTFVAQCSLSGAILGPPNYHDYQNKLRKLHAERFSRMPFEMYKSKVKIVKDEAVVKKWVEEQSWRTEFTCLNVPETKRLGSREEVEQHFREVHFANIIKTIEAHTLSGVAAQQLPSPPLRQLLRRAWDEQQRFPLKVVTVLSQRLAGHGLQFFKVNKSITHVAVARPHYLDLEATPVSEGVKRIVDYINAHSGCTRRQLIEALAPSPPRVVRPTTPVPVDGADLAAPPAASVQVPPPAAVATPSGDLQEPTPEQTAVIADLHWLIHQGHVIEFANGRIETARKPIPKPPRPAPKPTALPTEELTVATVATGAEAARPDPTESEAASAGPEISEPVATPESAGNAVAGATTEKVTVSTPPPPAETTPGSTQVASV